MSVNTTSGIGAFNKADLKGRGFKVHEIRDAIAPPHINGRRDYYKIVLVTGDVTIAYEDQTIKIKGTFLFFANPCIPHTVVDHSGKRNGYACTFTEAFIAGRERAALLHNSPLFRSDGTPVIPLNSEQAAFITGIYKRMLFVYKGEEEFRDELLRSCIALLLHEALRIRPPQNGRQGKNAATRITGLFMTLLERQFPVESTEAPLKLRAARDFAESLSVHVNYLNRSVKQVTGKPISVHIAERIAAEAKALLQYTNWSVADIAYSLGFEYPTYFNNYFKRITGATPKSFRKKKG